MDVDFLSGMIGELILDRDTLSLPGIGTFVAEDMPASFSDRGYTINPPYRRLTFSETVTDDGALAALYARDNSLELTEAETILSGFLSGLAAELRERGSVDLPGLGRLRSTREGHLFFVTDEALDISPDTFGLGPVSLKTHRAPALSEIAVPVNPSPGNKTAEIVPESSQNTLSGNKTAESVPETPQSAKAEPKPRRKRSKGFRWAVGAAAAVALLLLGFVALSRLAPEFTDRLLYTQEELSILNYPEDGLGLPG